MLNQKLRIAEILPVMESEFRKRGQSYKTQLSNLQCCQIIVSLHEAQDLEYLDQDLITEHIAWANGAGLTNRSILEESAHIDAKHLTERAIDFFREERLNGINRPLIFHVNIMPNEQDDCITVIVSTLLDDGIEDDNPTPSYTGTSPDADDSPPSNAIGINWDLFEGYWNAAESQFMYFVLLDDLPYVEPGKWESSALGLGELVGTESLSEFEAALTIRYPATEKNEINDALDERFITIYIDLSDYERNSTLKMKVDNREWYTYSYAGKTSEEAYQKYLSNIIGTWTYSHTTQGEDETPFVIHEFQYAPPTLEIADENGIMAAWDEIALTGNIKAVFYEAVIVGTWRETEPDSYDIYAIQLIREGDWDDDPERVDLLQYDPENGLLLYRLYMSDLRHYFMRGMPAIG